jgi:hypothetical protein
VFRGLAVDATDADRDWLLGKAMAGGLSVAEGMVGCSVTEMDGTRYRTPIFAGEAARVLDQVQYQNGDGPCVLAARNQEQCLVDEHSDLTWGQPGWAQGAAQYGVGCVLSIPLTGLTRLASMNFYASSPASFRPPSALARVALLGRAVAALIASPASAPEHATTRLADSAAVAGRALLARARSAVAQKESITDRQAFSWLARRSALEGRSILATARDMLADPGRQPGDRHA